MITSIAIYDGEGRLVNSLINNKMIWNKVQMTWEGTSSNGEQLETGMYIIWMEVFSENGYIERFKKVVVLNQEC